MFSPEQYRDSSGRYRARCIYTSNQGHSTVKTVYSAVVEQ